MIYANPDKVIDRAYDAWLRAPSKNVKNENMGAKWLRNHPNGVQDWNSGERETSTGQGGGTIAASFME